MGEMKKNEWKEFCSGCAKHYIIADGIWAACPNCDGAGRPIPADAKKGSPGEENGYVPLRERWKLNAR